MKKINLKPSLELWYLLGVISGDGCVYHRKVGSSLVKISVIDKKFSDSAKQVMENLGFHCNVRHVKTRTSLLWEIQGASKMFGNYYKEINGGIDMLSDINDSFKKVFIRGFYESEGCYYLKRHRCKTQPDTFCPSIAICNTDRALLETIYNILLDWGFHCKWRKLSKNKQFPNAKQAYQICFYRKEEIKNFIEFIDPCIKRGVY